MKIWTTKKADTVFRERIRERDKTCQHPDSHHSGQLQVSHFFGRSISSTRYHDDNCVLVCAFHHYWSPDLSWEERKGGIYREFMVGWLGTERFYELEALSRKITKRSDAIAEFQNSQ